MRHMGRQARGVTAMNLRARDCLIGMEAVRLEKGHKDETELILTVTENGYGKRTPVADYRLQSRAGKGVINVKATQRNGKVVSILNVRENSEVVIIAQQGKIIRLEAADIRQAGPLHPGRSSAANGGRRPHCGCLADSGRSGKRQRQREPQDAPTIGRTRHGSAPRKLLPPWAGAGFLRPKLRRKSPGVA